MRTAVKNTTLVLALLCGAGLPAGRAGELRDLTKVAVEAKARFCVDAREELAKHLELVSGAKPVAADAAALTIVLGERAPGAGEPAPFTSYAKCVGDRVYLWGDDSVPKGRPRRPGTLFAVYGFLEEVLGVRWVNPGDDGIVAPPAKEAKIPEGWSWTYCPPLVDSAIRTYHHYKGGPEYRAAFAPKELRRTVEELRKNAADRLRWKLRQKELEKEGIPFSHAFEDWNEKFFATHPEYLALQREGKRGWPEFKTDRSRYMKLCVSNEDVVDEIVRQYVARGKRKYYNICPNDGGNFCRCEKCRALDEPRSEADRKVEHTSHLTDRYLNFWNRIAKKVLAIRPDAVLCTYAYSAYREAPRRERVEYPDNMIFGMVPSQEDDNLAQIRAWKKVGMKHFKLRPNYLCYGGCLLRGYERFFLENFKTNYREGMIGTDYDGAGRDEQTAFEAYAVARVIQNPEIAFETVEAEFLSQFGKAAPVMKRYFARIRERGEKALFAKQRYRAGGKEAVLDDSLLVDTVFAANPRDELAKDLEVVREALATEGLTDLEKLRVKRYAFLAEHAVKLVDFRGTSDGYTVFKPDMVEKGLDLLDFRLKMAPYFPRASWGSRFRNFPFEVRWWMGKDLKREVQKKYPEMEHAE